MGYFVSPKWRMSAEGMLVHWCPGCKERHIVYIKNENNPWFVTWDFNGDFLNATFTPSICHITNAPRNIAELTQPVEYAKCHYFIRNGKIEFCPDSLHSLARQTVDLPDFPDYIPEEL